MSQSAKQAQSLAQRARAREKLRRSGTDFVVRWRGELARREDALRQFEAGLALLVFMAILAVGWAWDDSGARWAAGLSPTTIAIFSLVTRLGDSAYIFVLSAFVAVVAILASGRGAGRAVDATLGLLASRAVFVFAAVLVSGLFSQILKHLFGRARPKLFDMVGPYHFDVFSVSSTYASFPSGHTVTASAAAFALGWFLPRWRWALLALAALVGFSRLAVGAHYASDIVAGAALGIGSTLLLRRMFALRRIAFRPSGRTFIARRGLPMLRAIMRVPVAG